MERAMRQARKAQERLGYNGDCTDEWLPKPKGICWKTHYKLKRKVDYGNDVFCKKAMRRFNLIL
jgi:hypothetical protein